MKIFEANKPMLTHPDKIYPVRCCAFRRSDVTSPGFLAAAIAARSPRGRGRLPLRPSPGPGIDDDDDDEDERPIGDRTTMTKGTTTMKTRTTRSRCR